MKKPLWWVLEMLALAATAVYAQEIATDRVAVPFSDPSRPGLLRVSLLNGGITVKGYNGKDVIVEARSRHEPPRRVRPTPKTEGLRRLDSTSSSGLTVEEQDNVMSVGVGFRSIGSTVDLTIQVPLATNLNLKCVNDGDIVVDHVNGEIDVNNLNGAVTLSNISGAGVAHALNKDVTVTFDKVTPGKSMSFSSLNGDIDVTLPPDTKARVKMKSENGEIYSDFDIQLEPASRQPVAEDGRGRGGRYRLQFDKAVYGAINGGGPEMQFTTFNGKIYIRKKK